MDTVSADQPLSNTHYATLVLRLVLDEKDRLMQGELVEVERGSHRRFVDWNELATLLRVWITDDGVNAEERSV